MLLHWYKSLFADELWVTIHPRELLLQRVSKRLSAHSTPQIASNKSIEFPHHLLEKNSDEKDWATLVNYLKLALSEPICQGTVARLVLSNHFVRYAVIPWNKELFAQDERMAYTKHCFTQALGENIKGWNMRMSQSTYGQSTIASAVDYTFLVKLHEVFDALNMPLVAISPHLMLVINHALDEVKKTSLVPMMDKDYAFWIVSIQDQRLCIVLHDQNGWRLVKSLMSEQDVMSQIKTIIHREAINDDIPKELPILVYWPEYQDNKDIKALGGRFIQISPCHVDIQNSMKSNHRHNWALA